MEHEMWKERLPPEAYKEASSPEFRSKSPVGLTYMYIYIYIYIVYIYISI